MLVSVYTWWPFGDTRNINPTSYPRASVRNRTDAPLLALPFSRSRIHFANFIIRLRSQVRINLVGGKFFRDKGSGSHYQV